MSMRSCGNQLALKLCSMHGSAVTPKKTTCAGKSRSCNPVIPAQRSSKTSAEVSPGSGKALSPYWDAFTAERSCGLVVAHQDRLARFGFELVDWLAKQNGGEVVVLDESKCSPEQELTEDILSLLDTFSCRLSGLRKYRDKIKEDKNLSER